MAKYVFFIIGRQQAGTCCLISEEKERTILYFIRIIFLVSVTLPADKV